MLKSLWIGSLFLLIGCGGGGSSPSDDTNNEETPDDNRSSRTITFRENSTINTLNPDRGFYDADYELNKEKDYNRFYYAKEDGYTMVYAPINLNEYIDTERLSSEFIDIIDKNLKDATEQGVKLILRIKYHDDDNGNDPSKEIIMGHLAQLKPLLQTHKNIISIVQAGTIGDWGEWHSFTGDYADTDDEYKKNRRDIIVKLSEIFPDKYIQIRTPMHKELLFGSSETYRDEGSDGKITPDIAFTDDIRAKIGHHNDCFLASETDMGTYPSDNIDFWKNYVVNDTKYAPVGGETCKDEEEFTTCDNALSELKKFQYSYINESYQPDVIERWKEEGCYDEIQKNLGYRLVAKELDIEQSSTALNLTLSIANRGYASPYIQSEVNYVLKNSSNTFTFAQNIDTRTFYAQLDKELKTTLSLTEVESGEYCLYLQIGKAYSAIRLSNSDLWEERSKSNKLACGIVVE